MEGYFATSSEKINLDKFDHELNAVIQSRIAIQKYKKKNKMTSFILLKIISAYVKFVLPGLLKVTGNIQDISNCTKLKK